MPLFITVEGGEFVGKTSVAIPSLKELFEDKGYIVHSTRDPGGTERGEKLREEIFQKAKAGMDHREIADMFYKARSYMIEEIIEPVYNSSNSQKHVILSDRFADATRVHQGMEGGLSMDYIFELEKKYLHGYFPDVTFLLYFPDDTFEEVLRARQTEGHSGTQRSVNYWDKTPLEVHKKRQEYFLSLPDLAKTRGEKRTYYLIDASQNRKEVRQNIQENMSAWLRKYKHP